MTTFSGCKIHLRRIECLLQRFRGQLRSSFYFSLHEDEGNCVWQRPWLLLLLDVMLQDMKEAEDESPLTTNGDSCSSEEELFHLEMSNDEGSGGKRPKYHHPEDESEAASSSSSSKSAKDNELHGFGNPVIQAAMPSQKRGAGQPLCTSATEMTSKKARKMISISSKAAATNSSSKKDLQTLQSIRYEFGDDDPHMAKAAVYYLLLLEDQLVTKVTKISILQFRFLVKMQYLFF